VAWQKNESTIQDYLQNNVGDLSDPDRGLAWEIAFGTCRNFRRLQSVVRAYAKKKPPLVTELAICSGLYQIFFLHRVPRHAAVYVTVAMVHQVSGVVASKFANAILQRAVREGMPPLPENPSEALALEFSMPDWLIGKWLKESKGDVVAIRARCESSRAVPGQWIRVHIARISLADFQKAVGLDDARVWGDRWIDVGNKIGSLLRTEEFRKGLFSVQNPAADLLVRLLDVNNGQSVWDACAAPGGKSALLLERMPGIHLTASDIDASRLASLSDLSDRLQLPAFESVVQDACAPTLNTRFDRILLDVPCSNLGVVSRRPEVPSRLDPQAFEEIVARQRKILAGAAECLAPGGVLVYGTCSPEPEETTFVVRHFLKHHPEFVLDDASSILGQDWVKDGCVQSFDATLGFDGFFAARLRRVNQV
jgi:16S rRNA (cytosine967-C5)-methyltransferase